MQPTLTKKWNYIFVQILCSYFQLFISDTLVGYFLDVLFLLLAYQSFIRNQEGNIELQKKVHSRICVRKTTFLIVPPPFYDIFSYFLCLLRSPCQVMYLLNGRYKDA